MSGGRHAGGLNTVSGASARAIGVVGLRCSESEPACCTSGLLYDRMGVAYRTESLSWPALVGVAAFDSGTSRPLHVDRESLSHEGFFYSCFHRFVIYFCFRQSEEDKDERGCCLGMGSGQSSAQKAMSKIRMGITG